MSRRKKLKYLNRYRNNLKKKTPDGQVREVSQYLQKISRKAGVNGKYSDLTDAQLNRAYQYAKENHISKVKNKGLYYDKYASNKKKYSELKNISLKNQAKSVYFTSEKSDLYKRHQQNSLNAKRNYTRRVKEIFKQADFPRKEMKKLNKSLNKIRNMSIEEFSKFIKNVDGRLGFSELFFDSEDKEILGDFYDKSDYVYEYKELADLLKSELKRFK